MIDETKITDPGFAAHRLIESLEKRHDEDALEELHGIAHNALESLQRLAVGGNKIAANVFIQALVESIHQLYGNLDKQRDIFTDIARPNQLWPGFITVENDWKKLNEKVATNLRLGEDAPFNYKGKQFSRDGNPEVEAALILRSALSIQQRTRARMLAENPKCKTLPAKLPPFNRQTAPEWWKAGRKIFERKFGIHFENHPLFAKKYPATHAGKSNDLSFKTWKRKVILSKMPQAFRSIARKS
jgi:hypothetical protein